MLAQSNSSNLVLIRSLSGAVGLVCDVRLGILLACEIALLTTEANLFDNGDELATIASIQEPSPRNGEWVCISTF